MSYSVIIPCYNCEKDIYENLKKIKIFFKNNVNIVAIDDGSKDKTIKKLNKAKNQLNIKVIKNNLNKGKSYSIKKALKYCRYQKIILIDADLSYFRYLPNILKFLDLGYDLVSVNRNLEKSKTSIKNFSLNIYIRRIISFIVGYIVEKKLKLNFKGDTQAGLKGFKMDKKIKNKKFFSNLYFLDVELIRYFKVNKKKIKCIPVHFEHNPKSKIKFTEVNKNKNIFFEFIKVLLVNERHYLN